jgi:PAS domain S-box-containing protein
MAEWGLRIFAPITLRQEHIGLVEVGFKEQMESSVQDSQVRLLRTLIDQTAIALQSTRQFEETQSALAEVQQSQELLRSVIDATPDWIFIKDHEHRYRLANRAYAESMKIPLDEFIGKNDLELGFPEDIVKGNPEKGIRGFWTDDREVMESGQTKIIDVEPAEVDGKPVYLSTVKVPLRDKDGQVWAVLGYVRDITEREQLLAQVEQRARREQTIREITEKMRAATSLEQLVKTTAEELGQRFGAEFALVDLGVESNQVSNGKGNQGKDEPVED